MSEEMYVGGRDYLLQLKADWPLECLLPGHSLIQNTVYYWLMQRVAYLYEL